jgi:hypothetical protein
MLVEHVGVMADQQLISRESCLANECTVNCGMLGQQSETVVVMRHQRGAWCKKAKSGGVKLLRHGSNTLGPDIVIADCRHIVVDKALDDRQLYSCHGHVCS